ncbi:GNAT family N-acetyltransferase [Terricaulis sp.]|uniref:GNAT family N-acetyltransferase n=1 Tax=Terricaulis sp. TaxID=2768686 RepID=UPI003784858A
MSIGPTLETARLILRPPTQADFDGFAGMAAEAETMRFIGGLAPRDGAWRAMASLTGSWVLLGYSMFSVIEKASGRWIGRLGPWRPGGEQGSWPGPEVGWALNAAAQGKGYAREGATAAIDWAFDALGWDHVIHCIDKRNAPSIALAEKLGSTLQREDVQLAPPFEMHTVDIYGQTRDAWRARKR